MRIKDGGRRAAVFFREDAPGVCGRFSVRTSDEKGAGAFPRFRETVKCTKAISKNRHLTRFYRCPLSGICRKCLKMGLLLIRKRITPMAKAAAKAAPKAAAKAKVETISTRQLAVQLATKNELSNKAALALLDDAIEMITKHLKKGARVRLNGLGILLVRKRAARMGRNPATGEQIKIKASKKVAFRPAKELKEAI
jgi:DNA-binding protein HU-beta